MRITESQLRRIIREELRRTMLNEKSCMDENEQCEIDEAEGSTTSREYGGKEYKASRGSLSALRKSKGSKGRAVKAGKFAWAEEPYAAARAAEIVATGKAKSTRSK